MHIIKLSKIGMSRLALPISFMPADASSSIHGHGYDLRYQAVAGRQQECRQTLAQHTDYVTALAAAPDVGILASAGLRGEAFLWDVMTAGQVHPHSFRGAAIHSHIGSIVYAALNCSSSVHRHRQHARADMWRAMAGAGARQLDGHQLPQAHATQAVSMHPMMHTSSIFASNPHAPDDAYILLIFICPNALYTRALRPAQEQEPGWKIGSAMQGGGRGPQQIALGKCKGGELPGSVYTLAVNESGTVLAAGTAQQVIRICDARTGGKVMKLRGHTGNVRYPAAHSNRWSEVEPASASMHHLDDCSGPALCCMGCGPRAHPICT